MKFILLTLCFISLTVNAQPVTEAKEKALSVVSEITNHIKRYSLVKATFDWKGFDNEISMIDATKFHPDSLMIPYIIILKKYLEKGGDNHSLYIGPIATSNFKAGNSSLKMPVVSLLDKNIAIIKMPGIVSFNKDDIQRYADTLRMQIKAVDKDESIKGWIIDLRKNGGGTMWPMLAGLNPLLDDGTAGYFIDPNNKLTPWELSEKKPFGVGKLDITYKCQDRSKKIAVLIDSLTGSSGEMTVIAFLGLPNVRTFGQPTYGFTTANTTIPLSNGGVLLLATKYSADRNKVIYKGPIIPDVVTKYDESVTVALNWIAGNSISF